MLSRAEWDFGDLPDDQIEECWTYEFGRERRDLIGRIAEWREGAPEPRDFRSLKKHAGGCQMPALRIKGDLHWIPLGAYFMFPEWPKMPFQEIRAGERRKRFRELLENEKSIGLPRTKRAETAEQAWKDKGSRLPSLREIEPHLAELGIVNLGDRICMSSSVFSKANISKESTDQIVIFRINWDLADKEIMKKFSTWLKANRPRDPLTLGSVGGSNPVRKKQKELERLGKVRIVRFRDGDYTSDWYGKRLFADQSQWSKCRKSVEEIIAALPLVS